MLAVSEFLALLAEQGQIQERPVTVVTERDRDAVRFAITRQCQRSLADLRQDLIDFVVVHPSPRNAGPMSGIARSSTVLVHPREVQPESRMSSLRRIYGFVTILGIPERLPMHDSCVESRTRIPADGERDTE